MRITLHLDHFFNDHRSSARILISDKMKRIEDVESRVSLLFGINDFYLTSDDIYLPTAESVAVLKDNEIVRVVPCNQKKKSKKRVHEEETTLKRKKRSKKEKVTEVLVEPKLKKQKKSKCESSSSSSDEDEETQTKTHKRKIAESPKLKAISNGKLNKENNIPPTNSEKIIKAPLAKSDSSSSESSEEKAPINAISVIPNRRINIVKTVIISNGVSTPDEGNVTPCTDATPEPTFENLKRKRKRVRRRKGAAKIDIPKPPSPFLPRPMVVKSSGLHVRFDDVANHNSSEEEDEATKVNGVIKPTEMDVTENELATQTGEINEDFIVKQPIIQNIEPHINDVIAFKILRMSESYTPEISSFITGKVLSYDDSEILFDITYGLDQCVEPEGKFSMELNEEPVESIDSKRQIKRMDLLEPRLL